MCSLSAALSGWQGSTARGPGDVCGTAGMGATAGQCSPSRSRQDTLALYCRSVLSAPPASLRPASPAAAGMHLHHSQSRHEAAGQ